MIGDLRSGALPESLDTDVCVVGAGPVGITLALALSRHVSALRKLKPELPTA